MPSLDSIPSPQAVHVGQTLTFYVTALDCDGDSVSIKISGKPRGSTFVQSYNSTFQKQLGKFVFVPRASQANHSYVVMFTAREVLVQRTYGQSSSPQAVTINVLPELVDVQATTVTGSDDSIGSSANPAKVNIAAAKFRKSKHAIAVEGAVIVDKKVTQAVRAQALSKEVSLVDSLAGTLLGTAKPNIRTGKFRALVPADGSVCAIEAHVSAVRGTPKVVKGSENCN